MDRVREHPIPARVVGGIGQRAERRADGVNGEIVEHVFAAPAGDRNTARTQLLLDQPRQRLGAAHQNGDFPLGGAVIDGIGDQFADECGLIARRRRALKRNVARPAGARMQRGPGGPDAAGELAHGRRAAKALVERKRCHRQRRARSHQRVARGAAKAVDRLGRVADREYFAAEPLHKRKLLRVRILKLVDEHVAVTAAQRAREGAVRC